MPEEPRLWIICYDIRNDKRLRRVARVMEAYGTRVQKSVFECWVTREQFDQLRAEIAQRALTKEDSVRYYLLCKDCQEASETRGDTPIRRLQRYYIS